MIRQTGCPEKWELMDMTVYYGNRKKLSWNGSCPVNLHMASLAHLPLWAAEIG